MNLHLWLIDWSELTRIPSYVLDGSKKMSEMSSVLYIKGAMTKLKSRETQRMLRSHRIHFIQGWRNLSSPLFVSPSLSTSLFLFLASMLASASASNWKRSVSNLSQNPIPSYLFKDHVPDISGQIGTQGEGSRAAIGLQACFRHGTQGLEDREVFEVHTKLRKEDGNRVDEWYKGELATREIDLWSPFRSTATKMYRPLRMFDCLNLWLCINFCQRITQAFIPPDWLVQWRLTETF